MHRFYIVKLNVVEVKSLDSWFILGPIYMVSGGRANSSRGGETTRVTLSVGTTFSHINTLARLPEARWLKLFPEPAILSNM